MVNQIYLKIVKMTLHGNKSYWFYHDSAHTNREKLGQHLAFLCACDTCEKGLIAVRKSLKQLYS